jgi:hypothetical protein
MSLVQPPPWKPGDDLDGLLRAFFRSQMPHPWPSPRLPRFRTAADPRSAPSGHSLTRSRLVLAASAALLMLGSLCLPGRFTQDIKPGYDVPVAPTADNLERLRMKKEHENKNKPNLGADDGDFENGLGLLDLPPLR